MTNDQLLRLTLAVYGNGRHHMPHHQALEVADRMLSDSDELATAEHAFSRYDATFRSMF